MDRSSIHCVILQDPDGVHLGWVLWHPNLGADAGDCVFMPLPVRPELLGTLGVEALFARQRGGQESAWRVTSPEPLSVAVATPGLAEEMFVELDASGFGRWGFGTGDDRRLAGITRLHNT